MIADCCGGMIVTGMPGCMPQSDHEAVAAEPKSATGQYLKPLLERASTQPVIPAEPGTQSGRKTRNRKGSSDEDQGELVGVK